MDVHHLVKMANQIGQFFEAEPDKEQALVDIAGHIKKFWDPRMRQQIIAYAETDGAELREIVAQAIRTQKQSIQ